MNSAILGTGFYTPEKILTNFDLEKMVQTTDEWITQRTGIKQRRIAADNESTSDIALKASLKAIENSGIKKEEIDYVIVATVTGDFLFPATANVLIDKLGINNIPSVDISAACSGFVYGLELADALIKSGKYNKILLVGAETFSRIVNWEDRTTCILFGDGAGAVIIGKSDEDNGILSTFNSSDGSKARLLFIEGGGSYKPFSQEVLKEKSMYVKMNGREVYKAAIETMYEAVKVSAERAHVGIERIDYFIFHQANKRIIDSIAERFNIPQEKIIINLDKYGNTSAATIPIALAEAVESGKIKKGNIIALSAMGAGFTWGGAIVKL